MVLQYVAAGFHLPSVRSANFNTVQYPRTHQQLGVPTIPAVVISKVLLPQSNIMSAFVHSHSNQLSDVSSGLPTYSNHNITQCLVYSPWAKTVDSLRLLSRLSNLKYNSDNFTHFTDLLGMVIFFSPAQT
jgi:hypothetical protein